MSSLVLPDGTPAAPPQPKIPNVLTHEIVYHGVQSFAIRVADTEEQGCTLSFETATGLATSQRISIPLPHENFRELAEGMLDSLDRAAGEALADDGTPS